MFQDSPKNVYEQRENLRPRGTQEKKHKRILLQGLRKVKYSEKLE